jgi:hypothetical protein
MRCRWKRLCRHHPELNDYTWEEIYGHGDNMAPGGLYLAARMSRAAKLGPRKIVLIPIEGSAPASRQRPHSPL